MIQIDHAKCTGCGLCADDCIYAIIEMKDGKSHRIDDQCILCGHCLAICPHNAVTIPDFDRAETGDIIEDGPDGAALDYHSLMRNFKLRRSTRAFRDKALDRETIEQVIEAGRYAPTAKNAQNVSYIVVQDGIPALRKAVVKGFLEGIEAGTVIKPKYLDRINLEEVDYFFRGAPALILTVSEHAVNATIAAAHMEIAANALGLGVLYNGYFTTVANASEEIKAMLEVGGAQWIVTCLCVGYPDVTYRRSAPRFRARVAWK